MFGTLALYHIGSGLSMDDYCKADGKFSGVASRMRRPGECSLCGTYSTIPPSFCFAKITIPQSPVAPAPFTQGGLVGCRRFVQKDRRGRQSLHFIPRSGISQLPAGEYIALREQYIAPPAGEYIALREQYIAPPTGGISFIAKGDEYEHPSPSRFACHLSPRGEARFGSHKFVRNPRRP